MWTFSDSCKPGWCGFIKFFRSSQAVYISALGVTHHGSGEGGFGFVFHSVEVVDCSFYWRCLPVFFQTQRQTQSNGRHLRHTCQIRIFVIHFLMRMTPRHLFKNGSKSETFTLLLRTCNVFRNLQTTLETHPPTL